MKTDPDNGIKAIEEVERLEGLFFRVRSVFPALDGGSVGAKELETAQFYKDFGYHAVIQFNEPLTREDVENSRDLGKWVNENAMMRLAGILQYHNYYAEKKRIDQSLDGAREVDLMRRMRNAFSKTPLNYRPSNPDNKRLRNEVIAHFGLDSQKYNRDEIPTPIHEVVMPIFMKAKDYVRAHDARA